MCGGPGEGLELRPAALSARQFPAWPDLARPYPNHPVPALSSESRGRKRMRGIAGRDGACGAMLPLRRWCAEYIRCELIFAPSDGGNL